MRRLGYIPIVYADSQIKTIQKEFESVTLNVSREVNPVALKQIGTAPVIRQIEEEFAEGIKPFIIWKASVDPNGGPRDLVIKAELKICNLKK